RYTFLYKNNSCVPPGPKTWAASFPDANGPRQSPVDIKPSEATYEKSLAATPLTIKYSPEPDLELENPGLSFKANIKADSSEYGVEVPPSCALYCDFIYSRSQLHLVHYNTEKYASFGEAVTHSDGLSVIGVFIKVGDSEHKGFAALAENASKVKCKASKASTGKSFNPASLLPSNTSKYWTYEGSLTTPPCCESVRWIVLKDEISISPKQIQTMRDLCCDNCGSTPIPANYRPPLPLGSREIQASFQ
ncbi:hypothetical protein EGW08_008090, partial [Elysia chlorotica]